MHSKNFKNLVKLSKLQTCSIYICLILFSIVTFAQVNWKNVSTLGTGYVDGLTIKPINNAKYIRTDLGGIFGFINESLDFAVADFNLQQNSLAINTGLLANAPILDKDGNIRLSNNFIDIGCYEFQNALKIKSFSEKKLKLYPNPAKDYFLINLIEETKFINIGILDLLGRKIKDFLHKNESIKIDLSNLKRGIYVINITTNKTNFLTKILLN